MRSALRPNKATLSIGVTHTRYSIDADSTLAAAKQAEQVLMKSSSYQNQHIMGFGVTNPEPSPGVFDWSTLDRRMALIRRTGGTPVITLCCAPDWMKGGAAGHTDWTRLAEAPTPDHYADFASLAGAVARRYPWVKHYQVWNEMKGFFDSTKNRWNFEGYTDLYNRVYDTLKAINPAIQVGGPYVVMISWSSVKAAGPWASDLRGPWGVVDRRAMDVVSYWLEHKHGADFLTVDGGSMARDKNLVTDEFTATAKFDAVTRWLRKQASLPVWWAEWYVATNPGASDEEVAAVSGAIMLRLVASRASVVLIWQPEDDPGDRFVSLWTSTRRRNGGQSMPFNRVVEALQSVLQAAKPPQVRWLPNHVVEARGGGSTILLHVGPDTVTVPRRLASPTTLGPWEIRRRSD